MEERIYRFKLLTDMLGTAPKNKEIYATYVDSKKPASVTEDQMATTEDIEDRGWTGFRSDENGLFINDYMFRGFLKAAGEVMAHEIRVEKEKKGTTSMEKPKAIKSKIDKYVFAFPERIYLNKKEPDSVFERPLRCMTPQGPRVTLTRSDSVNKGFEFDVTIRRVEQKEITWDMIDTFMTYGQLSGLGQFRNGSFGRFKLISKGDIKRIDLANMQ